MARHHRNKKRKKYLDKKHKRNLLDYIALPRLSLDLDPDIKRGIFIVLLFAFGAISLLSLYGLAGTLGDYITRSLEILFGWGKWLFPVILLGLGYFLFNEDKHEVRNVNYLGLFLFIPAFHSFLFIFIKQENWSQALAAGGGGGYIGLYAIKGFFYLMGFWASLIVILGILVISTMLMFNASLMGMFGRDGFMAKLLYPIRFVFSKLIKRENGEEDEENEEEDDDDEDDEEEDEEDEDEDEEPSFSSQLADMEGKREMQDEGEAKEKVGLIPSRRVGTGFSSHEIKDTSEQVAQEQYDSKKIKSWWEQTNVKINLPLDLLFNRVGKPTSGDIKSNTLIIERALNNFGVPVEMGEVSVGPTVTQYTFRPAEGIKISRITALSNDLALVLAAHPIRIEAPIPGKRLVGVEVPNQAKAIVGLKEVMMSKNFKEGKSNLMIALGKDVSGRSWVDDLNKMPHLLVAGATGSGKSVCLHSIIISLLYQNNPDDLKFIMVDPKRVELPVYDGVPHLLTPVITDVHKTINALKWCLNEMDRRYELLNVWRKKDIIGFNANGKSGVDSAAKLGAGKLPYIIFIIDELADLMVAARREVEAGVMRLAQMARAVGIHLVLATQRPSVDIITGIIKANMPARIAFTVASGVDSRTILDILGAEKLLGRGDMLFTAPEISKPKRLQGAYVSEAEIKRIARFIKEKGGETQYLDSVTEKQRVRGIAGVGFDRDSKDEDELLEEAKETVINMGKASASLLQRKLSIGYARAARLLDILEEAGVVGPVNGAKPREVLISREQYDSMSSMGVSGVSLHEREEAEGPEEYLGDEDKEEDEKGRRNLKFEIGNLGREERYEENSKEDEEEDDEEDEENSYEEEDNENEEHEDKNKKEDEPPFVPAASVGATEDKDDEVEDDEREDDKGDDDEDDEGKYFSR